MAHNVYYVNFAAQRGHFAGWAKTAATGDTVYLSSVISHFNGLCNSWRCQIKIPIDITNASAEYIPLSSHQPAWLCPAGPASSAVAVMGMPFMYTLKELCGFDTVFWKDCNTSSHAYVNGDPVSTIKCTCLSLSPILTTVTTNIRLWAPHDYRCFFIAAAFSVFQIGRVKHPRYLMVYAEIIFLYFIVDIIQ